MDAIGKYLKEVREKRGYSQIAVEEGTKIPIRYIQAIEAGDFSQLPGRAYTIGFIRNYAKFLQVGSDELIEYYNEKMPPEEPINNHYERYDNGKNLRRSERVSSSGSSRQSSGRSLNWKKIIIVAVIAVVVIIVLSLAVSGMKNQQPLEQNPSTTEQTGDIVNPEETSGQTGNAGSSETSSDDKNGQGSVTVAPLNVTVFASKGNCNLTVSSDRNTEDSVISLDKGQMMLFESDTYIKITFSNAGAVDIEVNDQAFPTPGKEGEQKTVEYNINQL
ncbi:MAG: helix-turn-helix domain-containing protein [Bacillota bacterium]|jgi:cytoskeleton protein RodZ